MIIDEKLKTEHDRIEKLRAKIRECEPHLKLLRPPIQNNCPYDNSNLEYEGGYHDGCNLGYWKCNQCEYEYAISVWILGETE